MSRNKLPNRRHHIIRRIKWGERTIEVGMGFHPDTGELGEVFADMQRGGDLAIVCRDAAVAMSIAIQHGADAESLVKSMLQIPAGGVDDPAWRPASAIGMIAETILAEINYQKTLRGLIE